MADEIKVTTRSGIRIGFVGILTIVLVVLKAFKLIDWSWLWVLSPLWISTSIVLGIIVIMLVISIIMGCVERGKSRKLRKKREKHYKNTGFYDHF